MRYKLIFFFSFEIRIFIQSTGADPEFRGGSDKRPPTVNLILLLLFNMFFFHKKMYGENICNCFT